MITTSCGRLFHMLSKQYGLLWHGRSIGAHLAGCVFLHFCSPNHMGLLGPKRYTRLMDTLNCTSTKLSEVGKSGVDGKKLVCILHMLL